jgi:hypothetical protein
VVQASGAERGFIILDATLAASTRRRIWGVDLDGLSLGHADQRLPGDLIPDQAGTVVRRAGSNAGLGIRLQTGIGSVALVLEHRFRRYPLDHMLDEELRAWINTLAVGLRWALDAESRAELQVAPVRAEEAERQLVAGAKIATSLEALNDCNWNISLAARRLGMTRHGLKKRMRRLGLARTSEH